jgi:hypothetical protein
MLNYNKIYLENIKFKIDSLKEYHLFIESNFQKGLEEIQTKFDIFKSDYEEFKKTNQNSDEDYEDHFLTIGDDLSYQDTLIKDDFILKYRNSLVFLIYSFIEDELTAYCKTNSKLSLFDIDDLKGSSNFEKFKLFIKRTRIISLDELRPEIDFIDNLRLIRNKITHHNNAIKTSDNDFKKIDAFKRSNFELKSLGKSFKFENDNYIETEVENFMIKLNDVNFLNTIFSNVDTFFKKLYF